MNRQVLFVATILSFIKSFEMNDIAILQDMGYSIHIAANTFEGISEIFTQKGITVHHIDFSRSPFKICNIKAIRSIQKIIEENQISLVHCHTPVGSVIARLASKKFRKKGCRVIYTAHGLQFYKGGPKKDWMLYYPVEKLLSGITDAIITLNHEDYKLVSKDFSNKLTRYIPGVGVDLDKYRNVCLNRHKKRQELGLKEKDIMVLSVGELNARKNQHIAIEAMSKVHNLHIKYYIAGNGVLHDYLQQQINILNVQENVFLLDYRTDTAELLKCADVFILSSKHEGLSVALMEAMARGLPIICSKIRGNTDLIDDGKGGYLCDVNDINAYANAMARLSDDPDLRYQMSVYNQNKIQEFSINVVDQKMRSIYREVIQDNPIK